MDDYQQTIRALSDRIVVAQTPIRVLDAVKWDDNVRRGFLEGKGKKMPAVDRAYYDNRPLAFDSNAVKLEFQNIERDITRQLGQFNPVGRSCGACARNTAWSSACSKHAVRRISD